VEKKARQKKRKEGDVVTYQIRGSQKW